MKETFKSAKTNTIWNWRRTFNKFVKGKLCVWIVTILLEMLEIGYKPQLGIDRIKNTKRAVETKNPWPSKCLGKNTNKQVLTNVTNITVGMTNNNKRKQFLAITDRWNGWCQKLRRNYIVE